MRFASRDGLGLVRRALLAFGLVAVTAGGASAQLLLDGTILYENNASGTLAGQFSGTAPVTPPCPAVALTAGSLFTTTYLNNSYTNPLLTGAVYQTNVVPNWVPAPGSPAYAGNAATLPADGFFLQTCFKGAMDSNDWTQGWTYYDSTGANRTDIDYARPLAIYSNVAILGHRSWSADSNYEVRGQLRVKSQGSLSIAPGVVVLEDANTLGTIIVERGAALYALGTKDDPIIVTSNAGNGSMATGDVGGIAILGRAKTNVVNSCLGDSAASEGGAIGRYGGNDDLEGSGALRYVRVEYAGNEITPGNELNAFTWNACGSATRANFLQSYDSADDAFEWFGGQMNVTHLVALDGRDDGFDTQLGARIKGQFVIVRINPKLAPAGTQFGERGIEADNNEFNNNETQCAGRSSIQVANFTLIGDKRRGAGFGATASSQGAEWRRGTSYAMYNSIIYNFNGFGLRVSDGATWLAHCAAPPAAPATFCASAVGVTSPPISSGSVLVARSSPNPFRNQVNFAFTLPQSGQVSVEIYSAEGRHVKTIARGEMPAGQHHLTWSLDRDTPNGMYFYKVLAGGQQATGKITRVD